MTKPNQPAPEKPETPKSTASGNNRGKDELTPQERRAATLYTHGLSQTQAYRDAFNRPRQKGNVASSAASAVFRRPRVATYVKELFRALKKSDLLTGPEWLAGVLGDLERARERENDTAIASLQRVIAQGIGQLTDTVRLEDRPDSDALVARLAQDDPALAELLKRRLSGKQDFDA